MCLDWSPTKRRVRPCSMPNRNLRAFRRGVLRMSYRSKRKKTINDQVLELEIGDVRWTGRASVDAHSTSSHALPSTRGGEKGATENAHTTHLHGSHGKERRESGSGSGSAHLTRHGREKTTIESRPPKPVEVKLHVRSTGAPSPNINAHMEQPLREANKELVEHGNERVKEKTTIESRPPKPVKDKLHVWSTSAPSPNINAQMEEPLRETNSEPVEHGNECVKETQSKPARSRRTKQTNLGSDWPDNPDFDEKEDVLMIDREGHRFKLTGPAKARYIDTLDVGVRCVVNFNGYHQPLRKGGFVLVKYLGSLAKNKRFCPIGEKSWNLIHPQFKVDIIQLV